MYIVCQLFLTKEEYGVKKSVKGGKTWKRKK